MLEVKHFEQLDLGAPASRKDPFKVCGVLVCAFYYVACVAVVVDVWCFAVVTVVQAVWCVGV